MNTFRERFQALWQMFMFGLVGLSGLFVDYAVLIFCREFFDMDVRVGVFAAFPIAVTWNYELNRRFTFTQEELGVVQSYLSFVFVCTLGLGVRYVTMEVLIRFLGMTGEHFLEIGSWKSSIIRLSYIASFIGIVVAYLFNFVGSKYFAFVPKKAEEAEQKQAIEED